MQLFSTTVLLLLLTCQLATPIPIFDRDDTKLHSGYQSAGFGETIRDWFRTIKNRIVGKWQEWFGNDDLTPNFSLQNTFNIDKTIENRILDFPSLFLDLSSISFDPKRDWGIRIGNWYIIRKVTGNNYNPDSDSDEWDMRPLMPNLPSPPTFGMDWTTNIHEFNIPEVTQLPTTTPKIKMTTPRQTSQTQTESVFPESTVTLTESIPFTTQLIVTSTDSIATSTEKMMTSESTESVVTNNKSVTISTESILTSKETNTVSIESTVPSTESTVSFTESIVTPIESVVTVTESTATSNEEIITDTVTELPNQTSTELILPVFNKKIEENETINTRTTKKPRPASAEVIMF